MATAQEKRRGRTHGLEPHLEGVEEAAEVVVARRHEGPRQGTLGGGTCLLLIKIIKLEKWGKGKRKYSGALILPEIVKCVNLVIAT